MGKKAEEYMQDVSRVSAAKDASMIDILSIMREQKAREIIVTNSNHEIEGIITGSDIVREIERTLESSRLLEGTAEYVMTGRPTSVEVGASMIDVVDQMFRKGLHCIVVTKGYQPIGIITQIDVVRWWLDEYGQQEAT